MNPDPLISASEQTSKSRDKIHRLLRECGRELLSCIKSREPLHPDRWVPASELKDALDLDYPAAPKCAPQQQKKSWLFATLARMLENAARVEYRLHDGRAYYRSTPPPSFVLAQREYFLKKAAEASTLDRIFYASYFNEVDRGDEFDCPIDPKSPAPVATDEELLAAVARSRSLYYGPNAYVGEAILQYASQSLTPEEAVERLKRENPGFSEDVYAVVIGDSIQSAR